MVFPCQTQLETLLKVKLPLGQRQLLTTYLLILVNRSNMEKRLVLHLSIHFLLFFNRLIRLEDTLAGL